MQIQQEMCGVTTVTCNNSQYYSTVNVYQVYIYSTVVLTMVTRDGRSNMQCMNGNSGHFFFYCHALLLRDFWLHFSCLSVMNC